MEKEEKPNQTTYACLNSVYPDKEDSTNPGMVRKACADLHPAVVPLQLKHFLSFLELSSAETMLKPEIHHNACADPSWFSTLHLTCAWCLIQK